MLHVIISPGWAVVTNEIWLSMQNTDCLGVLVALLIKRAPFELEMIKKGSSACGSGVSVWPGSGSQQRWHHVIIRDRCWAGVEFADAAVTQSLPFIWALCWSIHKCVASEQFFHPSSPDTRLQPLWASADAGRHPKGFGPSCVNYSLVRGDSVANAAAAEVYKRQRISRLYHIAALISET